MLIGVARRLLSMLVTLFGVSVIIFVVLRLLPGNAVTASLGVSAGLLSHAQLVALDHYYGVGEPFFRQFGSWLGRNVHRATSVSRCRRAPRSPRSSTPRCRLPSSWRSSR